MDPPLVGVLVLLLATANGLIRLAAWWRWLRLCRHVYDSEIASSGRVTPLAAVYLATCWGSMVPRELPLPDGDCAVGLSSPDGAGIMARRRGSRCDGYGQATDPHR